MHQRVPTSNFSSNTVFQYAVHGNPTICEAYDPHWQMSKLPSEKTILETRAQSMGQASGLLPSMADFGNGINWLQGIR